MQFPISLPPPTHNQAQNGIIAQGVPM